jgi:hypothetical protein
MFLPSIDQQRAQKVSVRQDGKTQRVPAWPRGDKELHRVELESTWVLFSTLNHRTRAEQLEEISRTGRQDLFTADPLGEAAQAAQFRILCGQEGFEDLKTNLKDRGQQEPAIVTADGVLINGNRRAAALRWLFVKEDHRAARYITCLVLPEDATMEEIVDLESELQVARTFQEKYSWINEALLIEELYLREDRKWGKVATRMHRKEAEVAAQHEKLLEVRQIVELSKGTRHYVDFTDNESAFEELVKHIRTKSPEEAEGIRTTYYLGTLAKVNYRDLRNLRRKDAAELVVGELENNPSFKGVLDAVTQTPESGDDLLDDVLGGPAPSPLGDLLSFVASKKNEETLHLADGKSMSVEEVLSTARSAINAAAAEAAEDHRDQSKLQAPIDRSDKAILQLKMALKELPRARAIEGWNEQPMQDRIDELTSLVDQLKDSA